MIPLSFSSYKPLDKFSPSTSPPHSKTKTPFLLIKSQIKILKHIKVFAFRPHPKYFSWKNSSILPFKHGIPTSLSFYSNSPTTKPNQNSRVSFPVFPLNQSGNRSKTGGPKLTMMLEMCRRPLEKCFGGGDGGDGLLWHMDLKPHSSGDYSIAVVQANSALEDQGQVFTSPCATYVGVYDGHGGPEASRFITNRLFPFLHKFATEQGGLSEDVIRKAFDATEEEFLELVKRSWMVRPQIASVGSCCLVGAIADGILYVANLGDSRAVLGRRASDGQAVVAERLSTDHNVSVEEVRKEVKDLHPDDAHIVVYTHGVWRIKGIIQVSRSIGDVYLKKPEFNRDPLFYQFGMPIPLKKPVMTAEPSIVVRKLQPQDMFLIFATDGLWEHLSDETAVKIVSKNPRAGIAKRLVRAAIDEAARKRELRYDDIKRIERGARRQFHDDITVIVIFLDHSQVSPNAGVKDQSFFNCTSVPVDIFSMNEEAADGSLHTFP